MDDGGRRYRERIEKLKAKLAEDLKSTSDLKELENLRVRYLGKKGEITLLMRRMGEVSAEERPLLGKLLNELKKNAERSFVDKRGEFENKHSADRWEKERIDVTLPGRSFSIGGKHPVTLVLEEIEEIFTSMGFKIAEGPDVELDYYNFEALNMPREHPARDMQDSFYINPEVSLRTHTSPVECAPWKPRPRTSRILSLRAKYTAGTMM